MPSEIGSIIAYTVLWFLLFVFHYKKRERIGIAGYIMLTYGSMSLTSIYFYYNAPFMREIFNVTFWPFVFLFLCIFLWIAPFIKHSDNLDKIKLIRYSDPNSSIRLFVIAVSPFVMECFIELFFLAYHADAVSLSDAYANKDFSVTQQLTQIGRLGYTISHFGAYIWPIIIFYCISKKGFYLKLSIIPLIAYTNEILQGYVNGDRVTLVRFFLYLGIVFLLMKNTLSKKQVKIITRLGITVFSILVLSLFIITIGRFNSIEGDYSMLGFLSLYSGEGCIRFSQYIWDLNYYSSGDTCFSLIKDFLGLDTFTDNFDRREFYEAKMKIPTYIFYTFIGDFVQDFGKIGALLLSVVASLSISNLIKTTIKKGYCTFLHLFLISIVLQIIFFGFMYYNFKTYSDQLQLLASFLFFLFLDFTNTLKVRK